MEHNNYTAEEFATYKKVRDCINAEYVREVAAGLEDESVDKMLDEMSDTELGELFTEGCGNSDPYSNAENEEAMLIIETLIAGRKIK